MFWGTVATTLSWPPLQSINGRILRISVGKADVSHNWPANLPSTVNLKMGGKNIIWIEAKMFELRLEEGNSEDGFRVRKERVQLCWGVTVGTGYY